MRIELSNISKSFLKKCQREDAIRILDKIESLALNPYDSSGQKLKGENSFKIRVGKHRIIYEIYEGVLLITEIGKRQNIYK